MGVTWKSQIQDKCAKNLTKSGQKASHEVQRNLRDHMIILLSQ